MKMKAYLRKKKLYRRMQKFSLSLAWLGAGAMVGTSLGIGSGMSAAYAGELLLAETAITAAGFIVHIGFRCMERWTVRFFVDKESRKRRAEK